MSKRGPGRFGRLARLGQLTSKVTGSYLGDKVRGAFRDAEQRSRMRHQSHVENAERVVETLSRLKGAAMKAGQSLAMFAQHFDLPDEVSGVLSKLNAEAEPVPFETIRATLVGEWERDPDDVLLELDPQPLGTASLGQAHAGVLLDGTQVVIKVRHAGVDEAVDTDLLALRTLMLSGVAMGRDRAEIDAIFQELRTRLLEELDYLQEAANIHAFREALSDSSIVRIPKLYPSLCTDRVLVMDRLPGVPLDVFLDTATPEQRQQAGVNLSELFSRMAFVERMLHADPHPGNYLFEPDGRIGLLDFGCVKRFNEFWIGTYARAMRAALDNDRDGVLAAARDLGAWVGDDPGAGEAIWRFADTAVERLRDGEYTIGGQDDSAFERMQPVILNLWKYPEVHGPPDIVFLHRTLGGIYTMMRRLEVTAHWAPRMRHYASVAIDRAEGKTGPTPTAPAPRDAGEPPASESA